ncbi:TPA: tape measure protein [Enterococcus faecium]
MESYSVEAILSAVDKNFSSTMKNADSSMSGLNDNTKKTNTSILDIAKGIGVFKLVDSAIGLVKSSMDGAIDRFDTLNKYPVVMQALGYSAEEVDKSMNKLTDGIDGLPTSLDEIVSSAQQLAISTGDLQKGTDTALALNNAFLASGASTADASRGMQQYQQMLAKGTVDMQSWRTLQETMPIAMDKVAKSFKDQGVNSVNELYDALQDGTITFDDFNNRLIKLNDGVGGFAELAKKNSAGIRTSFSNIKTAVVKGLANVITAIDEGMQNAGLGSIAENFDKIKNAVNVAFKAITDSIPPAISFLTNLWDTIKPFLPLIMAVVGYIGIYQAVMGTARKAVELYNGAQKMMNVLMNLNPIGLVIAAVIALVAGFIYLWNTSEEFRNFWIGLWEAIKTATGAAVDWIVSAWEGIKQFFVDTWESIKQGTIDAWNALKTWLSETWDSMKQGAIDTWNSVKQFFIDLWESIKTNTINMWNAIKDRVTTAWENTKNAVINTAKSIVDGAAQAWEDMKTGVSNAVDRVKETFDTIRQIDLLQIGKDIIDGLVNGIRSKIDDVVNAVKDVAGSITGKIKDVLNIHSPSRVMAELGMFTSQGLAEGMLDGARYVDRASSQIADRASNMDIGNRISAVNSQIQTQVQHEVSYGTNSKPAVFKFNLGRQSFRLFVDDISQAMGEGADINLEF